MEYLFFLAVLIKMIVHVLNIELDYFNFHKYYFTVINQFLLTIIFICVLYIAF